MSLSLTPDHSGKTKKGDKLKKVKDRELENENEGNILFTNVMKFDIFLVIHFSMSRND